MFLEEKNNVGYLYRKINKSSLGAKLEGVFYGVLQEKCKEVQKDGKRLSWSG